MLTITLSTHFPAQNVQFTQNTADSSMRGDLQVDPSTLGMTLQVPLGAYPGRGLNLPVTVSYASKQWRIQTSLVFPLQSGTYHIRSVAQFAEHSVSGWTSSLDVPSPEYFGVTQPFNPDDGKPLC